MTPQYRTVDEHAFTKKDIKLIKMQFPKMKIEFYLFFTLFAFPFSKKKFFQNMVNKLWEPLKTVINKTNLK